MLRRIIWCLVVAAAATGCHRQEDYVLGPSQADQVLRMTLSATSLPADGIARATITAQLDPRTDSDKRNVTFTTTAGTLIAAGKEGTVITVPADTNGTAVAELRSSTTSATARIEVTVASVSRTASIQFQALAREQVFDVSVSGTSVPADGFSPIVITITLKRLGTPEQRAVKVETSAGTLTTAGQTNSRAVTVTATETGRVVAELQSDIAGTAHVRVSALDTLYEFDVTFTALAREDVFDVAVSRTSIEADGFSTATITATLKRPGGTPQLRTVKFETSAGMLVAAGQATSRAVTLTADATGRAVVELQSDKTIGPARVRVTVQDLPYEFIVTFTAVSPANIITVSAAPSPAPADGATAILVTATVAPNVPAGRRTVAFRTTLGQLLALTADADGSNMARASLVSTTAGVARITATVDGVTADTTAEFTAALPDRVIVAPDAVVLKSGDSTSIRVTLIRATGTVSPRLQVSFSAVTSTGVAFGSFSRVTLAENSVATAMFSVGTTAFTGDVTVAASVEGGATGTAALRIVP
jgi:adhesin/invasin